MYCRLTWDLYFYGSFLAIAVVQVFISFIFVIFGIGWIAEVIVYDRLAAPTVAFRILCSISSMLYSIVLIITTTQAWARGPKGAWKLGVKDLACTDSLCGNRCSLTRTAGVSLFGKRRKSDEVRTRLHIWASLKGVFIRRIPYVKINVYIIHCSQFLLQGSREFEICAVSKYYGCIAPIDSGGPVGPTLHRSHLRDVQGTGHLG